MPARRQGVRVKIETAPTLDELQRVLQHAVTLHDDFELADIIYRMATWFFIHQKLVWTTAAKDQWRYLMVRKALDEGGQWISGAGVFETVSTELRRLRHPAAAKVDQIEKSFKKIWASLPRERRRRRARY